MSTSPDPLLCLACVASGVATGVLLWSLRPVWDALTARYVADLTPQLHNLQLDTSWLPVYLRIWGVLLLGVPLLVAVWLEQPLLAVLVAFLLYRAPRTLTRMRIRTQRVRLRDQLVTACVNLANTSRAGLALPQGLETIIPETPVPLAGEFRRIVGEFHRGRPFPQALREVQKRLELEPFSLLTAALLVCLERGGKVTDALDRISKSLLENQRLERKREADTASGRKVVRILALTPPTFLCLFALLDPEGTSLLFTTIPGQMILAVVALLDYVSVRWASALLKSDAAAR